jgi:hypothetical protein
MAGAGGHGRPHALDDRGRSATLVEEGDMVLPGQTYEDPDPVLRCQVEQPARRHGVRANGVEAGGSHGDEVGGDLFLCAVLMAPLVGCKGAIGHAAQPEALLADGQKLAVNSRAAGARAWAKLLSYPGRGGTGADGRRDATRGRGQHCWSREPQAAP